MSHNLARSAYHSGAPYFTPFCSGIHLVQLLDFCVVLCPLFVFQSFFFLPFYCLSFFGLRFLVTSLVSSSLSYAMLLWQVDCLCV